MENKPKTRRPDFSSNDAAAWINERDGKRYLNISMNVAGQRVTIYLSENEQPDKQPIVMRERISM